MTEQTDSIRPLGPDSVAWRICGERRNNLISGYTLLLQVAHPAVGAGVLQHSDFLSNPLERGHNTLDSLMTTIFGGEKALTEAQRLRELHKTIKGIDNEGRRYHALHPEAYGWVHATLFQAFIAAEQLLYKPMSEADQEKLYAEWCHLGLIMGLRANQFPPSLSEFRIYFNEMVSTRLENNQSVQNVLNSLTMQDIPAPPWLPERVWGPLKPLAEAIIYPPSIGLLPPVLRKRLGLEWSERDAKRLRNTVRLIKTANPLVPDRIRLYPIAFRAKKGLAPLPRRQEAH